MPCLAGVYTIQVEMSGFKKEEIRGLQLTVAQTLQQDIKLELGQVTDSVTVEATAGQIQEREASLSQVIDERRVRELPINGRNFMQLAFLSSGIVTAGRGSATQRQASYGPAFSAGGQRDNTTTVLVDGIEISGMELNNYPYAIPSLDSGGRISGLDIRCIRGVRWKLRRIRKCGDPPWHEPTTWLAVRISSE